MGDRYGDERGGGGGGFRRPPRDIESMTSLRVGNLPYRYYFRDTQGNPFQLLSAVHITVSRAGISVVQ